MSESSFAEEMERQRIQDEERAKIHAEELASIDVSRLKRNFYITLLLYVAVGVVVLSAAAGLAVRVFWWVSGS